MADYIFRLKRGQSSSWVDQNIVLAAGEPGVELNTHRMKVGDGVTPWKDLPYTGISADEARAIASETANLSRVIVNSLEEIDITAPNAEKIIYMVPNIEEDGSNTYDEYMIIGGSLEAIGTTKTDLLNYVSKEEAFDNRPDWNQDDESAFNFIKNRIAHAHKTGKYITKEIVFEEQDLEFEYDLPEESLDSIWGIYVEDSITPCPQLQVGSYYQIICDGEIAYTGKAIIPPYMEDPNDPPPEGLSYAILGDVDWVSNSPKSIAVMSADYPSENIKMFMITIPNDEVLFHDIQIVEVEEEEIVKKIDKKFLYQPDWNQNDPTAVDYIKNRICYIDPAQEKGEESLWLDTITLSYENNEQVFTDKKLVNGAIYKVIINGQEQYMKASIFDVGGMMYAITLGSIMYTMTASEHRIMVAYVPYQAGISEELGATSDVTFIMCNSPEEQEEYSLKIYEYGMDYEISSNTQTVNFSFSADDNMEKIGFSSSEPLLSLKENQEYLVTINNRDYYYKGIYMNYSFGDFEIDGICLGSPDTFMIESNNPIVIGSSVYHRPSGEYIDACVFMDLLGAYEDIEFNLNVTIKEIFNNNSYKKISSHFIHNADWEATTSEHGYIKNKPFYPAENYQKTETILFKGYPDDLQSISINPEKQYWLSINGIKSELYQGFSMPYPYNPTYQIYGFGDVEYALNGATPKAGFYIIVFPAEFICDISVTDYDILNQKYGISNYDDFYESLIEIGEILETGLKKKTLDNQFISEDVPTLAKYSSIGSDVSKFYNEAKTVEEALTQLAHSKCNIQSNILDAYSNIFDIAITKNKICIVQYNTGYLAITSKDKISWNKIPTWIPTSTYNPHNLCSNNDNIIIAYQPNGGTKYISYDEGENWEPFTTSSFDVTLKARFVYKYDKFFCFTENSVFYSTNGKSWTKITYTEAINANDIVKFGDLYIICGNNGHIIYSNGFIVWKKINNFTFNNFKAIVFNGELYLLYDEEGYIYISNNGIDWSSQYKTKINATQPLDKCLYTDNSYLFTTNFTTSNATLTELWYSEDGLKWEKLKYQTAYLTATSDLDKYYIASLDQFYILDFSNATDIVRQKDLLPLKQSINKLSNDNDTSYNYLVLKDQVSGLNYILEIHNGNIVTYSKYLDIQVITPPNITTYNTTNTLFDPEGMVVTAISEDGSQTLINNYNYYTGKLSDLNVPSIGTYDFAIKFTSGGTVFEQFIPLTFKDLASLIDFNYVEEDGYYCITEWKKTLNGESNVTDLIVPSGNLIKI